MIRPASALQNGGLFPICRGLFPILTFSPAFPMIFTMKTMFQVGLSGCVPVTTEKRFLIHFANPYCEAPFGARRFEIRCAGHILAKEP